MGRPTRLAGRVLACSPQVILNASGKGFAVWERCLLQTGHEVQRTGSERERRWQQQGWGHSLSMVWLGSPRALSSGSHCCPPIWLQISSFVLQGGPAEPPPTNGGKLLRYTELWELSQTVHVVETQAALLELLCAAT